jgi:hypothetical protein
MPPRHILDIKPSEKRYLDDLRDAVYRDFAETDMCTLIQPDFINGATLNEMAVALIAVGDWQKSAPYAKRIEGRRRELINIEDGIDKAKKDIERLEKGKDDLQATVEHMQSRYGLYSTGKEITEAAEQEAQSIKAKASADAETTLRQANFEKDRIVNTAYDEAARIRAKAQEDARCIREEAERDCERLRSEQINKIDNLFPEFRTQIEEEYKRGIEDNRESQVRTALEMTNLRSRLEEDADSQRENFRQQQTYASRKIRDELTGCKNAISLELKELRNNYEEMMTRQANAFSEQIEAIARGIEEQRIARQNEISADIQKWKTEFYKTQYKELASVYGLFEESLKGDEKNEDMLLTDLLTEKANSEEAPCGEDPFREELHRRICNMKKLVSRLKNALAAVGIVEYVPEPGDKYDYDYHRCEDAEEGDRISVVKQNGMILKRKDEEDIVLLPADVEVDNGCN